MQIRKDYLPFGRPNFSDEEIEAVTRVMRSGWVGMGPEVQAFEKELSQYVHAPHVVTLSSCTAALHLTLVALGIKPGDEVVCPSLTWCSSANAALYIGAKVVFCDVDPKTLCVTPELILSKVTPRTKAVVVVHLAGLAIDVEKLRSVLPPHVKIVEDAAHALGGTYPNGQPVGSSGNPVCFSFYANKNLSTGEGGAVATSDEALASKLKCLRQHGLPADAWKRFTHAKTIILTPLTELGFKANYTDLQASIGRVQLKRMGELQARRYEIAKIYAGELESVVDFQQHCLSPRHALHLFLVFLSLEKLKLTRDELLITLRERNIGVSVHYSPLHKMDLYKTLGGETTLKNTEYACERILTLPISASMSLDDAKYVTGHIKNVLSK